VFDLSISKLLVLGLLALIIFGPEHLPKVAGQAGRALRDLRRIAESAKADLQEGLGPEFRDFDIAELNPKTFVRKHLWDEFDATNNGAPAAAAPAPASASQASSSAQAGSAFPANGAPQANGAMLPAGERPPYDAEAT
jgi:sec-independent protein translocase protein TatB